LQAITRRLAAVRDLGAPRGDVRVLALEPVTVIWVQQ
jgi:hypothetical protein